jgi:D-threo-aldose 1-dehydrogenase
MDKPLFSKFRTRAGRDLEFSALGFGSAPLGNMHRVLAEDEVGETLRAAWGTGARYFDTAPLYGHGLSEQRVGRFLGGMDRRTFLISTKAGRVLEPCAPGEEEGGIFKGLPSFRVRFDYSRDGIMRSFEASLRRLGLDRIDILLVHDVDARTHGGVAQSDARIRELMDSGGWRALSELRDRGVVDAIGIGVNEWEPCRKILDVADPDLFLLAGRYTLLEQEPVSALFPACAARGVGIVIGGPFNSGILAGKATFDYETAPGSVRARVQSLDRVCRSFDVPLAAAALQFPLAHPCVVSVIPGAQAKAEVEANARLMAQDIPAALWDALKTEHLLDVRVPVPKAREAKRDAERN